MDIVLISIVVIVVFIIGFVFGKKSSAYSEDRFENLANRIFQQNSKNFQDISQKEIEHLLSPLASQIKTFKEKVEQTYTAETRERHTLKTQIEDLVKVSQQMRGETENLTQALRGDNKKIGNWGEMILESVLESSGLRKGEEYLVQGGGLKLKDHEGRTQMPDAIVLLPEEKHLVIDSKVSLVHYEQAIEKLNSNEDATDILKLFISSLKSHINDLSGKKYHLNEKLEVPEFTMMFIPIEGALSMALQTEPNLFQYAWDKSIVLVSPTTLLPSLKTVANIWKNQRQTQNAQEIAIQSGRLYDKFVGFVESLEEVQTHFQRANSAFDDCFNKLSTGKGNLVSRVQKLEELGAKNSKKIPSSLSEEQVP